MILRLNLIGVAAALLGSLTGSGLTADGQAQVAPAAPGVLLLAHGGSAAWNDRVSAVARDVDATYPTEVALGMASRASIAAAVARLESRGVTEIVAVPLFVSSHSSVITSTEYLLGLRVEAPADLAIFAKMSHGAPGGRAPAAAHAGHAGHEGPAPTSPIATALPMRMTPAFNGHPLVAAIVADRAMTMSTTPAAEAVVLVAHGPVPDEDNRRWLEDMRLLAAGVQAAAPFAAVDVITVRDDAGPALREAATTELRALVSGHISKGRRVLVVPHLMSFGGIEQGIRKRLDGLDHAMAEQALLPDPRVAAWVRASVAAAPAAPTPPGRPRP